MTLPTHRVGFRHLTDGVWREPGELVDAAEWPNRLVLEQNGYIHALSVEERAELEAASILPQPTEPLPPVPAPETTTTQQAPAASMDTAPKPRRGRRRKAKQ